MKITYIVRRWEDDCWTDVDPSDYGCEKIAVDFNTEFSAAEVLKAESPFDIHSIWRIHADDECCGREQELCGVFVDDRYMSVDYASDKAERDLMRGAERGKAVTISCNECNRLNMISVLDDDTVHDCGQSILSAITHGQSIIVMTSDDARSVLRDRGFCDCVEEGTEDEPEEASPQMALL